ncbi:hypothetical protein [Ramlibacter sp.]|uniref:hypothetical protein n=1 Tax=Ramlibacter sp. TaxID=1917967 RepID=UPI00260E2813|nr:hypothetical protein [Ramlibacter sp.]
MSASQASAQSAIAFQLIASLEAYEADVGQLLGLPGDPEHYRRVGRHVDDMRMYVSTFPTLAVAWVEVLIRHFELTHGLWRLQQSAEPADLAAPHQQLLAAVARLRQLCLRVIASA